MGIEGCEAGRVDGNRGGVKQGGWMGIEGCEAGRVDGNRGV